VAVTRTSPQIGAPARAFPLRNGFERRPVKKKSRLEGAPETAVLDSLKMSFQDCWVAGSIRDFERGAHAICCPREKPRPALPALK